MARKKATKEETIIDDVPEPVAPTDEEILNGATEEEETDILDYLNEPNIRLGTDYRKKISFMLDGRVVTGIIRPLSSDEVARANNTSEMGQGALDKLVVSAGFFASDGKKKIPMAALDKFPAGVTSYIASEIMELSGFNLSNDAVQYLKKP